MPPNRRAFLAAALAAPLAAPAVARAGTSIRWRLLTAWNRNLPGPGVSAQRVADRIDAMSGGRLQIELFAAGQIVPAFGVFEAVSTGVAEMGHTAAFFWEGKLPGASLFTTAPFGLGPLEHQTWIEERGGQALWDELYAPFNLRAFMAGNTGPSMGGWFRKPMETLDDLKGLRIRTQGLGAEVYQALGAAPVAISPGDTGVALERGTIDAVELLAPVNDLPLGLNRYAPFYHMPGFNKPNGASEALISLKAWDALPSDLRAIVQNACAAEQASGLAQAAVANAQALATLIGDGAKVVSFGPEILAAMRVQASKVLERKAGQSDIARRIVASYGDAANAGKTWGRIEAYMAQALRAG